MPRSWTPQTRYTLRRNTTSIMKGLVWLLISMEVFEVAAFGLCFEAHSILACIASFADNNVMILDEEWLFIVAFTFT